MNFIFGKTELPIGDEILQSNNKVDDINKQTKYLQLGDNMDNFDMQQNYVVLTYYKNKLAHN